MNVIFFIKKVMVEGTKRFKFIFEKEATTASFSCFLTKIFLYDIIIKDNKERRKFMQNETEVADILFSLNKKAKNIREQQRNICYRKKRKITKSNKGEIQNTLNSLREQKFSYYEEKDKLLDTYFEPICIHKAQHCTREFEYIHNMKDCVDVETFMKMNFKSSFFKNFLEEKYQKKVRTITIQNREFKTKMYIFNDLIKDEELKQKILEEVDRTFPEVLIRGDKIFIPIFRKDEFYKKMDSIFVKYLWNGEKIQRPPYFKYVLEIGNIRIAQKENIVSSQDRYYLFYKIDNHSFHKPIPEKELVNYSELPIENVKINTKGENEEKLMDDKEIQDRLKAIFG